MVPLASTGPEVYVTTMTTVLSNSYDFLMDTLKHMKSIKLKDHPGGNIADFCDVILVDVEHFESAGAFKPEHLGYIFRIFEDNYDSRSHLWANQNYKEVMYFVKKYFCVTNTSCKLMISLYLSVCRSGLRVPIAY